MNYNFFSFFFFLFLRLSVNKTEIDARCGTAQMKNNRLTTDAFPFVRLRTLTFQLLFFFFSFFFSFFFAFILIGTFCVCFFFLLDPAIGLMGFYFKIVASFGAVNVIQNTWHFVPFTSRYMCTASAMLIRNNAIDNARQKFPIETSLFNDFVSCISALALTLHPIPNNSREYFPVWIPNMILWILFQLVFPIPRFDKKNKKIILQHLCC